MLPQFGYIVAQAGADSRPTPSPAMYTAAAAVRTNAPRSSPPPPPPQQQQQQKHQPTTHSTIYTTNAPPRHQPTPYQQQQQQQQQGAPLISSQQQQPLYPSYPATGAPPWMYSTSASIHGPTKTEYHTQYYSSNYDRGYAATVPPPPRLPQAPTTTASIWQTSAPPPPRKKSMSPIYEHDKPPPTSGWHQEDPFELNDSKMIRRLRDCNDVMAWMDHDFTEQRDEMYHEKRLALQKELKSIQDGDHAVFQEQVADLEVERDQAITSALCFETYQQTMAKQDLDMDIMMIEEEYKEERRQLDETVMLVLDDYRKQIKDDRGDVEMDGLFDQVLERLQQKKQFRKRTTLMNGNGSGTNGTSSRQETSSRGRRLKNTTVTPLNINAPMSLQEEEDVEAEYLDMKGTIPKRHTTTSRRS